MELAPQVTGLRKVSGSGELYWVYVDGERIGRLKAAEVEKLGLRRGEELSPEQIREVMRLAELNECRLAAVRLLSYRGRSKRELERRLKSKGFGWTTIASVLEELERAGYINDAQFARDYAERLIRRRKYGPFAAQIKLRQQGISQPQAEEAVQEALEGLDEFELAEQAALKRLDKLGDDLDWRAKRRRLWSYLARRGFSYEVIEDVVRRLVPAPE